MKLIKVMFLLVIGISASHAVSAEDYSKKEHYTVSENIFPGLTCEHYMNGQMWILRCKDEKYGCEYFKVQGTSTSSLTLREGSCNEKPTSTHEKKIK